MLVPTAERIEDALERLSPDDRALLELSLRRGVSDDDIAGLLHVHREHVEHRREIAIERLAEDLDTGNRAEVAALIGQSGRLNGENGAAEAAPAPHRRASELPPSPEAAHRARRRRNLIGLAAAAVALAVLAIALSSGGDDPAPAPAKQPAPAPAAPAAGPSAALTSLVPGAGGSARIAGSRLELELSGLPAGAYAVWLFDDVSDARMIARFDAPRASLSARLPQGFGHHRFIDISREPADGNANHSGASVLRVPLARLLRR
jgi:hypothetical protein